MKDFEDSAGALGALVEEQGSHAPLIVCATLKIDRYGTGIKRVLALGQARDAWVVVVEGPVESSWETAENYCVKHGWVIYTADFVTTEFGEAMARRRRFALIGLRGPLTGEPHKTVVKAMRATPATTVLSEQPWQALVWREPWKVELDSGIPRKPMLPHGVGHYWETPEGERRTLYALTGPVRWPFVLDGEREVEQLMAFDRTSRPSEGLDGGRGLEAARAYRRGQGPVPAFRPEFSCSRLAGYGGSYRHDAIGFGRPDGCGVLR